ncbi:MAG: hypothetical protein RLZZ455_435, partial [Candidatus Parcubacteria bacterium]
QLLLDEKLINENNFNKEDLIDVYNYFFNKGEDMYKEDKIFSINTKEIFEGYIKSLYSSVAVEAVPIINSSLRSGYSIRLAEEKIFNKSSKPNIYSFDEIFSELRKTEINVSIINREMKEKISFAVYISMKERFKYYYLDESVENFLCSIIDDNINYLIPGLVDIYEGKNSLRSLGGLPRYFEKPIVFSEEQKKMWEGYITFDTVFGYCAKIAESVIETP